MAKPVRRDKARTASLISFRLPNASTEIVLISPIASENSTACCCASLNAETIPLRARITTCAAIIRPIVFQLTVKDFSVSFAASPTFLVAVATFPEVLTTLLPSELTTPAADCIDVPNLLTELEAAANAVVTCCLIFPAAVAESTPIFLTALPAAFASCDSLLCPLPD